MGKAVIGGEPAKTEEQIEKALRTARGNVVIAAQLLERVVTGLYTRIRKSKRLQEVLQETRSETSDRIVDKAEIVLEGMVELYSLDATKFALDRLGKERGYSKEQPVQQVNVGIQQNQVVLELDWFDGISTPTLPDGTSTQDTEESSKTQDPSVRQEVGKNGRGSDSNGSRTRSD